MASVAKMDRKKIIKACEDYFEWAEGERDRWVQVEIKKARNSFFARVFQKRLAKLSDEQVKNMILGGFGAAMTYFSMFPPSDVVDLYNLAVKTDAETVDVDSKTFYYIESLYERTDNDEPGTD